MVRPKKHLGQHFLTDQGLAERIADSLTEKDDSLVIEIGPGKGVLTKYLLNKDFKKLIAVELDPESTDYLLKRWPGLKGDLVQQDFLDYDLDQFREEDVKIIGNFPYNISSQIFFRVLRYRDLVSEVVCMLQKEVAERISSAPGSKQYGILSVLLQAYFSIEYLFTVKAGSFFPPPKVKSGVIRLVRNDVKKLKCNEDLFFTVVKTAFNQRRKTLRNSLRTILLNLPVDKDILSKRPEQMSVDEFIELTHLIDKIKKE